MALKVEAVAYRNGWVRQNAVTVGMCVPRLRRLRMSRKILFWSVYIMS